MLADRIVEAFESDTSGTGFIGHGYTYSGHPVGAAAAIACLAETKRLNVVDNAAARGKQLYDGVLALKEKYEVIGDVRGGHGLMVAIELVSDRETKTSIDKETPMRLQDAVYQNGVMVRVSGPNVILSPPLILTEDDTSKIISALDAGFASIYRTL